MFFFLNVVFHNSNMRTSNSPFNSPSVSPLLTPIQSPRNSTKQPVLAFNSVGTQPHRRLSRGATNHLSASYIEKTQCHLQHKIERRILSLQIELNQTQHTSRKLESSIAELTAQLIKLKQPSHTAPTTSDNCYSQICVVM